MGLENSAMMCSVPLSDEDFFSEPISVDDYSCPQSSLPLEYPNWNEKWYSPVCREWYQDQKKTPYKASMTDLYTYSTQEIGLTQCVPMVNQTKFEGALCLDIAPIGELNKYFEFDENQFATYLIFNYEPSLRNKEDLLDTDFKAFIDMIVINKLKATRFNEARIMNIRLYQTRARLYQKEMVEYGRMTILATNKEDRSDSVEVLFWFNLDLMEITMHSYS